jgi:hypothetical protein
MSVIVKMNEMEQNYINVTDIFDDVSLITQKNMFAFDNICIGDLSHLFKALLK